MALLLDKSLSYSVNKTNIYCRNDKGGGYMDQLRALKYFVKVVETGSFTQAAKLFAVPPSSLSRRVADLEAHLGATLLQRSTRSVNLTEVGRAYYQQVRDVLAQLDASDEAVGSYQSRPMGRLSISSMVGFGETILLPLMDEFSERYPDITLDVRLSDELSTLGRDEVDIAIRGGYAPKDRVVAVKLMDNYFVPAASPEYLSSMGTPGHPRDLARHRGLFFRTPQGPSPWVCELNGQRQVVSPPAALVTNAGRWLVDKALRGQGIVMLPRWVIEPYLKDGRLRELAFDPPVTVTHNPDLGIYLLYQKPRYQTPKIKAMVDFLVERVREPDLT